MKPRKSIKKYMTKGYRRVRYKKGYGVHSPFAFSLITQVINEQMNYYAYENIRKLRKINYSDDSSLFGFSKRKRFSSKKLFLIYRLINKFRPNNILQIGSDPIITYTLGSGLQESKVYTMCTDSEKAQRIASFLESYVNNDIHGKYNVINSDLNSGITNLNTDITFDFIFINSGEGFGKWNDLNKLIEKINKNTVILIEGIKNDERIKLYWDYLRSLDTVKVSMDLYDFGLLIFDEKLYKQHYIVAY